jgi:hypothetical protein
MLIVMAQIITAVQMIYEEKYVTKLDIPALQAVGWEGKSRGFESTHLRNIYKFPNEKGWLVSQIILY